MPPQGVNPLIGLGMHWPSAREPEDDSVPFPSQRLNTDLTDTKKALDGLSDGLGIALYAPRGNGYTRHKIHAHRKAKLRLSLLLLLIRCRTAVLSRVKPLGSSLRCILLSSSKSYGYGVS